MKGLNYGQGLDDGRVESYQFGSSTPLPRYEKVNARLYHPFSSWCAKEVSEMKLELRFIEQRNIVGFITQSHPMQVKYVEQAQVQVVDDDGNWITTRSTENKNVS